MREIKFRAWNKLDKKMFAEVVAIHWRALGGARGGQVINSIEGLEQERIRNDIGLFEIMQYTGLKDKNGVEIYEGDIVQGKNKEMHKVVYEPGHFIIVSLKHSHENFISPRNLFEVIGNIYTNPELLEGK